MRQAPPGFDPQIWSQLESARAAVSAGDVAAALETYRAAYDACVARADYFHASVIAHQAGVAESQPSKRLEWNTAALHQADLVADRTKVAETYASNLNNLGMTYAQLGEPAKAIEAFRGALEHVPALGAGPYADQVRGAVERNLARELAQVGPKDVWATSRDGTRIHAYEWGSGNGVPLVFVPGGTGNAWSGEPLAAALGSERRIVGISRRGMGMSSAPAQGYTPAQFADDVQCVVSAAGLGHFVYFGHSMGVPIGLEYVLRHPTGLAGVVLGDAPPMYIDFAAAGTFAPIEKMQMDFADWDECFRIAGLGDRERFDRIRHRYFHERDGRIHALMDLASIRQTVEESKTAHTDYWPRLREINVPVLLIHATDPQRPVLTDEHVERYRAELPNFQVARLSTDHSLGLRGDHGELIAALREFLGGIDKAPAPSR